MGEIRIFRDDVLEVFILLEQSNLLGYLRHPDGDEIFVRHYLAPSSLDQS